MELVCLVGVVLCAGDNKFPPGFKFGAATAAYQIEGAWNASDKGENIWDRFVHSRPEYIRDGATGDIAADSYHKWREDVQLAVNLGLDFYRFSISWSRVLPNGMSDTISEDGIRYYNDLIDELLDNGIQPIVTLYHWDLPQRLQDLGGWVNPQIIDWFGDYARVIFNNYADRVQTWITINEAINVCDLPYNILLLAPDVVDPEFAAYLCNKNVLMAHANAWRIYDKGFKPKYHGKVSLANNAVWFEPMTEGDEESAELAHQFCTGRYSHAIYSKSGGWPPSVERLMAKRSREEGRPRSKLPPFTRQEKAFVRGTYDFYGLNFYTSRAVRQLTADDIVQNYYFPLSSSPDAGLFVKSRPEWARGDSLWFYIHPEGIRKMLVWLKKTYGNVEIMITENGYPEDKGTLVDDARIAFFKQYMEQVQLATTVDKVNVVGYTAWSLIDNFEWADGYRNSFGLHEVNFTDPLRTRTPRKSARYYTNVIKHHTWNVTADDQ